MLRLTSKQKYFLSKSDDLDLIFQIKIKKSYTLIFICNPTVGILGDGKQKNLLEIFKPLSLEYIARNKQD